VGVRPIDIGRVATEESIKISHCQLGLFGYPGGERPVEKLKSRLTDELLETVRLRLVEGSLPSTSASLIASFKSFMSVSILFYVFAKHKLPLGKARNMR